MTCVPATNFATIEMWRQGNHLGENKTVGFLRPCKLQLECGFLKAAAKSGGTSKDAIVIGPTA